MKVYPSPDARNADITLRYVSLGAGVQSTALALLAEEGRIEADVCIFADTGWEPKAVYRHVEVLKSRLALPILHVSTGSNIREDALGSSRFASMPVFTRNDDGSVGMLRRQCTREYKIAPIRDKVRELVADRLGVEADTWRSIPKGTFVVQHIGISRDEAVRARDPRDRWAINSYPLLGLRWTRDDCRRYLADKHGIFPPRSACIGCPFHTDDEWRRLRDESPDEWDDAVEFDRDLRNASHAIRGDVYLHSSAVPLDEVDLSTPEDHGQQSFAMCGGTCWT